MYSLYGQNLHRLGCSADIYTDTMKWKSNTGNKFSMCIFQSGDKSNLLRQVFYWVSNSVGRICGNVFESRIYRRSDTWAVELSQLGDANRHVNISYQTQNKTVIEWEACCTQSRNFIIMDKVAILETTTSKVMETFKFTRSCTLRNKLMWSLINTYTYTHTCTHTVYIYKCINKYIYIVLIIYFRSIYYIDHI